MPAPLPGPPLSTGSIPHMGVPFMVDPYGNFPTVQQGTKDEVTQCVAMLVGTRPGTRMLLPAYGTPDPTFGQFDIQALTLACQQYEPRASVTVVTEPGTTNQAGAFTEHIAVEVYGSGP